MRILYADDEGKWHWKVARALTHEAAQPHVVTLVPTIERLHFALKNAVHPYDLVIVDDAMPSDGDGLAAIAVLRQQYPELPIIIVSERDLCFEAERHRAVYAYKSTEAIVAAAAKLMQALHPEHAPRIMNAPRLTDPRPQQRERNATAIPFRKLH